MALILLVAVIGIAIKNPNNSSPQVLSPLLSLMGGISHGQCANEEIALQRSEIYLLGSMALQIPARTVAEVREDCIDAGLRFLLARLVRGFAIFLGHCVELFDLASSRWLAA
jgi:hypothetical protein